MKEGKKESWDVLLNELSDTFPYGRDLDVVELKSCLNEQEKVRKTNHFPCNEVDASTSSKSLVRRLSESLPVEALARQEEESQALDDTTYAGGPFFTAQPESPTRVRRSSFFFRAGVRFFFFARLSTFSLGCSDFPRGCVCTFDGQFVKSLKMSSECFFACSAKNYEAFRTSKGTFGKHAKEQTPVGSMFSSVS